MSNGKIFFKDITKNATITVTSEQTSYEDDYLTDEFFNSFWRSSDITEQIIKAEFDAATAIEGMFLANHNIESGDTTFEAETSANDFADTEESGTLILKTKTVRRPNNVGVITEYTRRDAYYAASWNRQYYRYRLDKASGNYTEASQIKIFADVYEFVDNFRYGVEPGDIRLSNESISYGGNITKQRRYNTFQFPLIFDNVTEAQKEKLEEIADYELIAFFPYGVANELYFGVIEVTAVKYNWTDNWNVTALFRETK